MLLSRGDQRHTVTSLYAVVVPEYCSRTLGAFERASIFTICEGAVGNSSEMFQGSLFFFR